MEIHNQTNLFSNNYINKKLSKIRCFYGNLQTMKKQKAQLKKSSLSKII